MYLKNIEKFFLTSFLKITLTGIILIILSNLIFYPEDKLSIAISILILIAIVIAYLLQNRFPTFAVVLITSVALLTMSYQRWVVPNTSTTLSVVLIVGFIFSVMLKGRLMWIMHAIAVIILNTIFVFHLEDAVTAAITYSILYFIITYSSGILKWNYDKIHDDLKDTNIELNEKAKEVEAQNEELLQIQENLNEINTDLEKLVYERTKKIKIQNDILLKYSYTNAHDLRGPVARLLGLAYVFKLEENPDPDYFIEKMLEQAEEIDLVIKKINTDLDENPVDHLSEN